jgi:hypothetical protein
MTKEQMDELGKQCDDLIVKVDRATGALSKRKQRFTLEHDDGHDDDGDNGTVDDTWSEAADAKAKGNNASLDDGEYDGEYDDDDDEEEDVGKRSVNEYLRENSEADRPGSLKSSTHSHKPHKFEALVTAISNTEGVPRSYAMSLARQRHPDDYDDYVNGGRVSKRADDLIEMEIRKGFSPELAKIRVANLYGFRAFDHDHVSFAKGCLYEFADAAADIYENSGLDRCESLRKARLSNPRLFKAMQGR